VRSAQEQDSSESDFSACFSVKVAQVKVPLLDVLAQGSMSHGVLTIAWYRSSLGDKRHFQDKAHLEVR
jgi:hypothetical protein